MPLFKKKPSLEDELINLRITSKQMQRASKKSEKKSKEAEAKVKKVSLLSIYAVKRCINQHF